MSTAATLQSPAPLPSSPDDSKHTSSGPVKKINDGGDLTFFLSSQAYRDLTQWLLQLNRAMFPEQEQNGQIRPCTLNSPPSFPALIDNLQQLLHSFQDLIKQAPPETGPRRFGNVAFRTWYKLAETNAGQLLKTCLRDVLPTNSDEDGLEHSEIRDELQVYLLGAFGSAQRLDYGTGHELSFLAFLGCLWKSNAFKANEERAIVVGVIQPYLDLVRKLILTYTLEPAGSHGVWGLDDHSFLPYIFGSAQFGPAIQQGDLSSPVPTEGSLRSAPPPSSVTDKDLVAGYRDSNMYMSAIHFIYEVKKGPFWEHSPILYDVSGIKDGWGKINKGMLKMYAAEVLGKFPVVQHFPFGRFFLWERDPSAAQAAPSFHAQQQPRPQSQQSSAVTAAGQTSGTMAPWAKQPGTTMQNMQATTGMPTSRMPSTMSERRSPMGMPPPRAAPTSTTSTSNSDQRSTAPPPTTAPWARTPNP